MIKKIIPLFLILIMLCGCSSTAAPENIKFYVVSRDLLSDSMTESELVSLAENDGRLVFDGNDISGYNWQTHTVTLYETSVPSRGVVTAESGGSAIFKTDDRQAFVLTVNGDLIYTGGFAAGSKTPEVPLQPSISDNGDYSFKILFDAKYSSGADSRNNTQFYNYLKACGKLSSKTN